MKKWSLKAVVCLVAALLTGAVAVSTVDKLLIEPRTISSWGELLEDYLDFRSLMGPVVPPSVSYKDSFTRMKADNFSFLAQNWSYKFSDGIYYVAKDSKLSKLKLPLHIQIYEDLQRGEIVVLSSIDGEKFQGEALFKAPAFMPYEKDFPLDLYAFDELAPRRVVWEITLKAEADAWTDLMFRHDKAAVSKLLEDGGMMRSMSVPEANTNDLWLHLEPQTNGINLNIYVPAGFTNRVEVYATTNLVDGEWSIVSPALTTAGNTNLVWTDTQTNFPFLAYRVGNADLDSDGDGLVDAREVLIYKTDRFSSDTDGDFMNDAWELQNSLNPRDDLDMLLDPDHDMLPNVYEYHYGLNPNINDSQQITKLRVESGSTAQSNTYETISEAFAASSPYSIIEVAHGLYSGYGNTQVVFPGHPVMLMSEDWGTNRGVDILSDSFAAFMLSSEQDNRTIIRGLNIRLTGGGIRQTGFYLGQGNNLFTGAAPYFDGVRVDLGNSAWAVGFYGFGSTPKTIRFNNCIVRGTDAANAQFGVYLVNSPSVHLSNCSFLNFCSSAGGSCGILLGTSSDSYGGTARDAKIENCFWDTSFASSNNYAVAHTTGAAILFNTGVSHALLPDANSLLDIDSTFVVIQTNGTALPDGLILSNSPCINAATKSPLSWYDFHGQIRDASPDIGADEYSVISTNDTDGDGLQDYAEAFVYHTAIFNYDTDHDGVGDGDEISCGTSPTNRENYCVTIAGSVDNRTGLSAPVRASWSQGSKVWNSGNAETVVNGQFSYAHKVFYSSQRIYVQVLIDLDGDNQFDSGEPYYTAPLSITNHTSGISFVLDDADGDKISDGTEVSCGTDPNHKKHYCVTLQGTITNLSPLSGPVYAAAIFVNQATPPSPYTINAWNLEKAVLRQVTVTNGTFLIDHVIVDQRISNEVWQLWLEVYQDVTTNAGLDYFEPATQRVVSVTNHTMSYELELSVGTQDMDYDHIPDWWEYENGLSITNQADAFADFDGDWIDNLWEYKLGYDPHVYNTNNYAFAEATRAVDTRIAGKNPTNAIKIYSTQNHSAGIYERNTNCWAADIDLTSCSPWNSYNSYQRAGTLISPRHAIFVNHLFFLPPPGFWVPEGNTLRFVDSTNGVYTATIASVHHLNTAYTDLTIAVLTEDVPTNRVSFAKILPTNFTNYLGHADIHIPGLCLDQQEKALVHELSAIRPRITGELTAPWLGCGFQLPMYGVRTNFHDGGFIAGDSGNPGFIIINGEPILLTLWVKPGGGIGEAVTLFKNEINSIMSQAGSYSLTELDLSGYDEIPVGLR